MRIDKPVFCFQINSELYKHLGFSVEGQAHRGYLRTSLLSSLQPHYASHAQIIECFHGDSSFVAELKELAKLQLFVSLSRQSNVREFLDGRRRMYDWDRLSYPMYFTSDLALLRDFPTVSHSDPSTTAALRQEYGALYLNAPPKFENWLDLQERGLLQKNAQSIAQFVRSEEGALTAAFFKRIPGLLEGDRVQNLLSKILPTQFTNIYQDVFEGYTATGIPHLATFEDNRSFPYCDFGIVSSIFIKLGLQQLIFDASGDGVKSFLDYRLHRNFPELVRAKDRLLYTLTRDPLRALSIERAELQVKVRGLTEVHLIGDARNDPLAAASELYRLTEQFCSKDKLAARRKLEMPDALSWKGKYLIFTATDVEDDQLHLTLTASGFGPKIIEHHERFTCVTRFRADVGKVFHVRTSAGSGGASGATIMGQLAIDELKPQFAISVGICFGMKEDSQRLCDVVVSEKIHDYENRRISQDRPEDRGATREAGPTLLSRARAQRAVWDGAPIHVGTIASGEKLVDDRLFRDELKASQPPPIAGDMESWGLSAVCHSAKIEFIMVKGICDWGFDKEKDKQLQAARNACEFALRALVV